MKKFLFTFALAFVFSTITFAQTDADREAVRQADDYQYSPAKSAKAESLEVIN